MKLYAQGLARRLHVQRVGMTEEQMMQRPEPPDVLQNATNRYNSGEVHVRNDTGDLSKCDETTQLSRGGSAPRERRVLENRVDRSAEDTPPIDAKLEFERRVARTVKALSAAEQNAVELIVLGHSDRSVAEQCGVHRVTVTRWRLYNPAFRAELSRRRQEVAGATADGFRHLAANALIVMSTLLQDPNPAVRFRAARSVLAMSPRFAPPDEPIDVEGVLTDEARKLNVQLHGVHPADAIVYEDERQRALDHLMRRAGEDYTVDDAEPPGPTTVLERVEDGGEVAGGPAGSAVHPTLSPLLQADGEPEGSNPGPAS